MDFALTRKLTTIIVADVAGYSRLMSRDEEGTFARFAALCRELIEPAIAAHAGTLIKSTGDGFLAEFASVVEATRAAVAIQRGAAERNAAVPADERMAFRMGINLGDIIVEGDDIFGDGVNVAARLEQLAEPGSIVVSRAVRDHVRDKLDLTFEDLGERPVKNIARPVRAFRVRPESERGPERHGVGRPRSWRGVLVGAGVLVLVLALAGGTWWARNARSGPRGAATPGVELAQRLSVVVLPFANLGANPREDYLADGVTDSLTTDLSRALPGSSVVARGIAFTYRGRQDATQVGRDLNVRYVITGSITPDGERLRVNAHLVDAQTSTELWAERFDKKRTDLLEVQDQIVARLSRAAGLQVIDIEARRSERTANPTAVDYVMRGQAIANRPASRETMVAARAQFRRALEHDPENVDALAGVASTYVFEVLNSYYEAGREERLRDAEALIRRALAIQPRHIVALKSRAAWLRAKGDFEDAIEASKAVIGLNPGEPWAYKEVGLGELYLGRFAAALEWFDKAEQIGPRDPSRWIWLGAMGRIQFFRGRDDDAIRLLRLSADANPNDSRAYALLAAVYASGGRAEEARQALAECLQLRPNTTVKRLFAEWSVPLQSTSPIYLAQHERLREGLRRAGMPEE